MKYYVIYRKLAKDYGTFVCIVENEEIAKDFCNRNKGFDYLEKEVIKED